MIKKLIKNAINKLLTILRFVYSVIFLRLSGRVPFNVNEVASNFGVKGTVLPHFSSRLYKEVNLLNESIGGYRAKRSLEIGCGYGRLTPWIAEHSDTHYAIEPGVNLISYAKKLYPKLTFIKAKAQKIPFPDNYFDLCISWTVLGHIPTKIELIKAINEIKRVCTKESIIILAEGIGTIKGIRYNEYTLEEWIDLFKPFKLSWSKERKIEYTFKGNAGLIMKFKRSN